VRWQEREAARAFPAVDAAALAGSAAELVTDGDREQAADAAGYRSLWDAAEVEHSPSLEFLFRATELV